MNSPTLAEPRDTHGGHTNAAPAISLAGLSKDFGPVHAVSGIDLEIEQGEVVLPRPQRGRQDHHHRRAARLSRPSAGSVDVLGLTPRQAIGRGLVSAVMQTGGLLKDLTVRETVAYTASLFADTQPVHDVLAHAGISGLAGRKVASAPVVSSSGCGSRGRCCPTRAATARRADHRRTSRADARSGPRSARTPTRAAPC